MTYKDAMEYPFLIERIEQIKVQMADFEQRYYEIAEKSSNRKLHIYNNTWRVLSMQLIECETRREAIEKWLASVPDRRLQTVMFMRFVDNMTWVEIGERMNCKADTVKKSVHRYMRKEAKRNLEN